MLDERRTQPGITETEPEAQKQPPVAPTVPEPLSEEEVAQISTSEPERVIVEPSRPSITERGLERVADEFYGEEAPEKPKNDLSDLFEVPSETDNDMEVDDLFELDDYDDLSDLTRVTDEDIMGSPPKPKPRKVVYRRTGRHYTPPTSIGGIR